MSSGVSYKRLEVNIELLELTLGVRLNLLCNAYHTRGFTDLGGFREGFSSLRENLISQGGEKKESLREENYFDFEELSRCKRQRGH